MTDITRITLIHATKLAVDPIVSAFEKHWPEVENISLLDEALSIDRSKNTDLTADIHDRIVSLARYSENMGSAAILYTCSAFGSAIEAAAQSSSVPVLKPNEAMFDQAFSYGGRVVMVYTFPPAVDGMVQEFQEEAKKRDSTATIDTVFADGAREALEQGDGETHNRIIADTVAGVKQADVILLAHFSMARAAELAQGTTDTPVLNSPGAAVEKLKAAVLQSA